MKILTICTKSPFPSNDGGTLASASLLQIQHNLGIETTCVVMSTAKHPFDESIVPEKLKRHIRFHAIPVDTDASLPGAFENLFGNCSYHFQRFTHRDFSNTLSHFLVHYSFDAILMDGLYAAPYLELIKRITNTPVILRAHNIEHEIWQRYASELKNPLKKWYFSLQAARLEKEEQAITRQVDGILPISQRDADYFRKHNSRAVVRTIPFAIDFRQYPESTGTDEPVPTVAHIGAMDWLPNQEGIRWFLEKVWPLVINEIPRARFYLAGRKMPDWLFRWNSQGVHIVGEVKDAVEFIGQHSIFVVPLFSGSGLRIKILEAMAVGKPIVATSLAARGIEAEDHKEIILADNETTFAREIRGLITDKDQIARIGQNACTMVNSHFAISNLEKKFNEFLKDLGI